MTIVKRAYEGNWTEEGKGFTTVTLCGQPFVLFCFFVIVDFDTDKSTS